MTAHKHMQPLQMESLGNNRVRNVILVHRKNKRHDVGDKVTRTGTAVKDDERD